jgi:hypothetical protein
MRVHSEIPEGQDWIVLPQRISGSCMRRFRQLAKRGGACSATNHARTTRIKQKTNQECYLISYDLL